MNRIITKKAQPKSVELYTALVYILAKMGDLIKET
jgi:hypothetical protein